MIKKSINVEAVLNIGLKHMEIVFFKMITCRKYLKKIDKADIIVYATPLYHFGMTSDMQKMTEKTLPLLEPYLIKDKKLTSHPKRNKLKKEKWVIISVCGFSEIESFQSIDLDFQQKARVNNAQIIGKIYRPASETLISNVSLFNSYLKSCYLAGQEVINKGKITESTQKRLYKDFIMPKFLHRFMANRFWKKELKKNAS